MVVAIFLLFFIASLATCFQYRTRLSLSQAGMLFEEAVRKNQDASLSKRLSCSSFYLSVEHCYLKSSASDFNEETDDISPSSFDHHLTSESLYQPFADHAWHTLRALSESMQLAEVNIVPATLQTNTAPALGSLSSSGCHVNIHVKGLAYSSGATSNNRLPPALKYARTALLDTIGPILPSNDSTKSSNVLPGLHVLNLVIFPSTHYDLPIFGADIVSLPGDKHLVAIDLQPIRTRIVSHNETTNGELVLSERHLSRLRQLHSHYSQEFLCGGDIPDAAKRFFSPYALWTRLSGPNSVRVLQTSIFQCFQDYLALYIDILEQAPSLLVDHEDEDGDFGDSIKRGHYDYLSYRRTNDPARPLLKRLFGEEWSESLIAEVLFRDDV